MTLSRWKNWQNNSEVLIPEEIKYAFSERAAICEFNGNQPRVEAELVAIKEVEPFLEVINDGERLVIPNNAPAKYKWWQNGQHVETTLLELGASAGTIRQYIGNEEVCND